jgi:hypothetical protein
LAEIISSMTFLLTVPCVRILYCVSNSFGIQSGVRASYLLSSL